MSNKKTLLKRLSPFQLLQQPVQFKPLRTSRQWFTECGRASRHRHLGEICLDTRTLEILTFNIQAGLNSSAYKDYLAAGFKQFLPSKPNFSHMEAIAQVICQYDMVALQELDGGSHRSGDLNQLVHLAQAGGFQFWHQQLNRDLGRFGQFSNGFLSQFSPFSVEDHRLPGLAGRGAIICRYGPPTCQLVLCSLHLALSEKARFKQLEYITQYLKNEQYLIILGDMNSSLKALEKTPLSQLKLSSVRQPLLSYPSWQPQRSIDHILVSSNIKILEAQVISTPLSDHLPISMRIQLPQDFIIQSETDENRG